LQFGLALGTITAITNGTTTIYPHLFPDTLSTMRAIESERCTSLKGPPTVLFDLINHPDRLKYDLSTLEFVTTGASVVPKDLVVKIKDTLKLKSIIIGYAMTETGCTGTLTRPADAQKSNEHAYETIGTAIPYVEVKIVNTETGELVERNKDGEICIRSFANMKAYWEDDEKTNETIDKKGL
jgi:fatty-acyl-CoA synthase